MDIASLQAAIIAHLQWKSKLSDFFYGVEDLTTAQVPNHTNCDFGKWLYPKGLREFSVFPEMEIIEPLHQEIHEEINRLIQMPKAKRKSAEGIQALNDFRSQCDEFVALLEKVEKQAVDR